METTAQQEIRQNPITKQWVICAPTRNRRPKDFAVEDPRKNGHAGPVDGCPFCPGHEEMLPGIISELNGVTHQPWYTRVVPNKYPALTPDRPSEAGVRGMYHMRTGYGRQEVLIDTPHHYEHLALMPEDSVQAVIKTYLERYHAIRQGGDELIPFLFRNHGAQAGASLPHPHSQIIATRVAPPHIQAEEHDAHAHYEDEGTCLYCTILDEELSARERIVFEDEHFVTFVPYAAEVPCEMWIMPRAHNPEFGRMTEEQVSGFATALHDALYRLHVRLGNPDYNFFIRTALEYNSEAPHLHWYMRILPRTTKQAGFELSTGMRINPSLPELDADFLRD